MSADNWTTCPRCRIAHDKAIQAAEKAAEDAYGKVPVDEWKELEAKAVKMAEAKQPYEFREDYEIYGADDGVVRVRYSGHCTKCGLSLEFAHEAKIEGITVEAG